MPCSSADSLLTCTTCCWLSTVADLPLHVQLCSKPTRRIQWNRDANAARSMADVVTWLVRRKPLHKAFVRGEQHEQPAPQPRPPQPTLPPSKRQRRAR